MVENGTGARGCMEGRQSVGLSQPRYLNQTDTLLFQGVLCNQIPWLIAHFTMFGEYYGFLDWGVTFGVVLWIVLFL